MLKPKNNNTNKNTNTNADVDTNLWPCLSHIDHSADLIIHAAPFWLRGEVRGDEHMPGTANSINLHKYNKYTDLDDGPTRAGIIRGLGHTLAELEPGPWAPLVVIMNLARLSAAQQ